MPYPIDSKVIDELDFDDIISDFQICTFNVKKDFLEDSITISLVGSNEDFSNYEIRDILGEETRGLLGDILACVDKENHILYTGVEVKHYILLKEKISQFNSKALNKDVMDRISDFNVSKIVKMMNCFETAFKRIHPGIPMIDIARYRLANHLLLLNLDYDKVLSWIELLNKHEIVDYSFVDSLPYNGEQGVLYVPKDRSRSQSTFKHIYEKYILNPLKRDVIDIYDPKITVEADGYYVGNKRITKVVFLFDLIQNGKATKDTLDYYLNKNSVEDNIHMFFYCNGKKVSVAEIIEMNNKCEVEVYAIYSGEGGRKKVQEYLNKKLVHRKCTVLEPLKKLSHMLSEEDDKLCKLIYKGRLGGKIYPGDYIVVREYNQPKHNIMSDDIMKLEKVTALFCKRAENY